ncbi:FeoB-associated Cys-rich membrane protein [Bacillus sp. AFS002410]|nr:FeoB-associated Cys-rich membrane protein [Bacillus sp. AFS002410]
MISSLSSNDWMSGTTALVTLISLGVAAFILFKHRKNKKTDN